MIKRRQKLSRTAAKGRGSTRRIAGLVPGLLFVLAIALPLAFFGPQQVVFEGRSAAPFPSLPRDLEGLEAFPSAFEAYFTDHLGFRRRFVNLKGYILVKLFGTAPNRRALLGKDQWLFTFDWPVSFEDSVVQQHRGIRLLSTGELESWLEGLERRRRWLQARGTRYLFVIAPHKHSIYPEFLPDWVNRVRPVTPADQLVEALNARSRVQFLDLRGPLLAAKSRGQLYWRTDTHWTDLGAYVAYREILAALGRWWPELTRVPLSDFGIKVAERYGNLVRGLGLVGVDRDYYEIGVSYVPRWPARMVDADRLAAPPGLNVARRLRASESPGGKLTRGVMLHDSFGYPLMPLLSPHVQRMFYLRRPGTQRFLDGEERTHPHLNVLVEDAPTDVVIDLVVERNLVWAYRDYH